MAGIFRKVEEKLHLEKKEDGRLQKEEMMRFEEKGGKHQKEEVVHLKEEVLGGHGGEIGYPNHMSGGQHESGLAQKIKQKIYKKKEKIGRKGAGDHRDDSSSSDSD